MKLAIFLPNWVGDACMAIPALRALRLGIPHNSELIGVSRPGPAALLRDQPWIDDWLVYQSHASSPILNRRGLVAKLRKAQCDAAILMTNSMSSAALAAFSRVPRRIGYARDLRSWLLTDRLNVPTSHGRAWPVPAIDYYLQIAKYLGCPSVDRYMELTVDSKYLERADQLWKEVGFCEQRPTVVINNNSANNPARLWPEEYVERLASKLVRNLDVQVLLHCSPSEVESANAIARRVNHSCVQSMGQIKDLPFGLSQAVFARASTVVTTDSGARHLAVAMHRPVITLFGPTHPSWTTTYNVPEIIVRAETVCDICLRRSKHKNNSGSRCECMPRISPERVYKEVLNQLNALDSSPRSQAA